MHFEVEYIDRTTGAQTREQIYAASFLSWLHNSRTGNWFNDFVVRRRWVSRVYGWWHDRAWSSSRIRLFVEQMGIDVNECAEPVEQYRTFNEFFMRKLKPEVRPIAADPEVCIAPVDGKVFIRTGILPHHEFLVKNRPFDLDAFVSDRGISQIFVGGDMAVCRLSLADYHHVHFPVNGIPREPIEINGGLSAGGPYALRWPRPFYNENLRVRTLIQSQRFGDILLVEVGALTVGSIRQNYAPGLKMKRGAPKSCFALGGSTVVLLFQQGVIRFDEDIVRSSARGLETRVLMGESIGRSTR